jgi:hypothetical protein
VGNFNSIGYAQVVAKAWSDDAFRSELMKNPREVLHAHGISIPESVEITIKPGTGPVKLELPLPAKPAGIDAATLECLMVASNCCCC